MTCSIREASSTHLGIDLGTYMTAWGSLWVSQVCCVLWPVCCVLTALHLWLCAPGCVSCCVLLAWGGGAVYVLLQAAGCVS